MGGAVSAGCYDKEWFLAADFSVPLYQAAKGTFCGGMLFRRTLAPTMKRYVDEALFRFREEERFSRCMYEVLGAAGLTDETYKKKASKHMATAFEEAHTNSPYGTMVSALIPKLRFSSLPRSSSTSSAPTCDAFRRSSRTSSRRTCFLLWVGQSSCS